MGASSSKDSIAPPFIEWRSLGIRKTQCDAPAPPPPPSLNAGGSSAPPPPPAPEGEAQKEAPKDSIAEAAAFVSSVPNPGPLEHASMDCKRLVSLDTFDGMRVDINKQLSPYMAVVHSFWLGTSMIPDGRNHQYTFLTQVADEAGLLMARIDPIRGSVDGRIHRALLGGLAMGKLQVGVSAGEEAAANDQLMGELDFGGMTWTGNLKYGAMGGGIMFGCNYFQSITPRFAMGGEGLYISANKNLLSNYTVKYTMPKPTVEEVQDSPIDEAIKAVGSNEKVGNATMVANYNAGQGLLALNYKRDVTPNRVTLGAELQCSPMSLDSQVLVGAEFKLARSKVAICVDGTGKVQSCLEAKLGRAPGSPTLNFSGELDHGKQEMKFGYGINIDG